MQIFDRLDPMKLDRRHAQLWVLAIAMIIILATGVALLLYPAGFSMDVNISGPSMRRFFFSFCALSFLIVGYLIERRFAIQNLRRRLAEEEGRNARLLKEASIDLLRTLPSFEHFQDALTMEYRRATIAHQPLSVVAVSLAPLGRAEEDVLATAYGDAAKSILRRMRREDSIYLFRHGVFGMVLPGVYTADAYKVAERMSEGLAEVSGPNHRFSFELKVINYPDHASSEREIENLAAKACKDRPLIVQAA